MKPRHVLVTGAGGFIGSHLVEGCLQRGWCVRAFVHYRSEGGRGWLDESPRAGEIETVAGDIRDGDAVRSACRGVDTVFHLAALIGIPYSYESPLSYLRTNVEGCHNVLQACREHEIGNLVITSSSEVYGSAAYVPIDESHPQRAQSPYAATKIAADQLAASFQRTFGLPVKIVRPFNTYGPRQSMRAVVPNVIAQLAGEGGRVRLGNTGPRRDFTYVADVIEGFLAVAECDTLVGEVVNLGSGRDLSIGELVGEIAAVMGVEAVIESEPMRVRPPQSEVDRLLCEAKKIRDHCGWQARWTLTEGLSRTVEWYRARPVLPAAGLYAV